MSNCKYCNKEYVGSNKKKNVHKHEIYCLLNPNREKYICDKCDREFDKRHSLIGHKSQCGRQKIEKIKIEKIYKCKYCEMLFEDGSKVGGHTSNCKQNPNYEEILMKKRRILSKKKGIKLSEEHKKKISKSRKDFLMNNPDKVPYLLNHSRNESYPEKYFENIFDKEGLFDTDIGIEKSYRVGLYELDFSIPNKKIDIEIDGDQHYYDSKIVESDDRRNKYLVEQGWDIIRIKWSDYQKMNTDDKRTYINSLIGYIKGIISEKPIFDIKNNMKECECGEKIYRKSNKCSRCYHISQRRVERPNLEQLNIDIEEMGFNGTGRKYGVSDNTIRKWLKNM